MKKQNKISAPKAPSAVELLAKAKMIPVEFNLAEYREVIVTLRGKGMTFRGIADWLSLELHRPITHTQVFRMLQVEVEENPEHAGEQHNHQLSIEMQEENEAESKGGKK